MKRFHIQWHLLDRCNLRCRHCYQEDHARGGEMDLEGLKGVAENLLEAMAAWDSTLDIALTGGEPLVKEEFFDLLDHLNRARRVGRLSIITNGTLLAPNLDRLSKFRKMKEFRVSLDGVTEATNDAIRGKGTFKTVMKNLEAVKPSGIPVALMFTVMRSNLAEAALLPAFAREIGAASVILERFVPLGTGLQLREEVLDGRHFQALWGVLLEQLGLEAEPRDLIRYRGIKVTTGGPKARIYGSDCIVGSDGMALMPDGTVYPCRRLPLPVGNLRKQRLVALWGSSDLLRSLRDRGRLGGRCGACAVEGCIGCRAMAHALTGDPLAEDPHCWLEDWQRARH
jgi:radical SAM protein with 4Fe4S-binding SPASM domain